MVGGHELILDQTDVLSKPAAAAAGAVGAYIVCKTAAVCHHMHIGVTPMITPKTAFPKGTPPPTQLVVGVGEGVVGWRGGGGESPLSMQVKSPTC
jgi:hypothetical protein